jgi:hypothetical protein
LALGEAPSPEHASILIREGEWGFLALARGEAVRSFELDGAAYGGESVEADRGLEVLVGPSASEPGAARTVLLRPVFRGLGEKGEGVRAPGLSFEVGLSEGETLLIDASPDCAEPVVRALFFDLRPGGAPVRRRMWLQMEVFR